MADDDDAKKAREEAVKAQDNPPAPYPSQEQLDKIQAGEGLDDEDDDAAKPKAKPEAAKTTRAVEADKPAGYQTR